jgi:RNA polymerase sigma-70 factor (ECF subfamily)
MHDLEALQKGEPKAWDLLTAHFYKPIYYFIYGMVRQTEEAEELTQDVFVNLWAKRAQLQIDTSLKSYIYRAARNHALNHLKRKGLETSYQRGLSANEVTRSVEQDFQLSELEARLHQVIERLPEKSQDVFKLSRFEELSYKEIADVLNIPIRQVHYHISIALKELRDKLLD